MYFDALKKIICEEFLVEEDLITEDSRLKEDLGIDSLASMQLLLDAEREFNIHVENDEVTDIVTVSDVLKLIEKKVNG